MVKMTVNDYAKKIDKTVQSVYGKIKRGTLETVEEYGVKYVLVSEDIEKDVKPLQVAVNDNYKLLYKQMKKEVKRLNKLNEKLNDKLLETVRAEKENSIKIITETKNDSLTLLKQYIGEMKLITPPPKKKKKTKKK